MVKLLVDGVACSRYYLSKSKARESASFYLLIFGKPKPGFVLSSRRYNKI
jgi:hypothetical protein